MVQFLGSHFWVLVSELLILGFIFWVAILAVSFNVPDTWFQSRVPVTGFKFRYYSICVQVLGSSIWISVSGFQFLGSSFWAPVSGLQFLGSGFWAPVSGLQFLGSSFWAPVSGLQFLGSSFWAPVSEFQFLSSSFWVPVSRLQLLYIRFRFLMPGSRLGKLSRH